MTTETQFATSQRLYPYPNGWYMVGKSTDLAPKQILTRTFMGEEIVVYRTESGKVVATHAYCPHLGAHLGFGGEIVGENIKCPFHFFEFDTKGVCVKTGYDTPPPIKCKIPTWHIQEKNGLLLVWHDAKDNAPDWEIPQIDWTGWSPIISEDWTLKSHPQESSENSVDIGHFSIVHGYDSVRVIQEPYIEGSFLKGRYGFERDGFLGKWSKKIQAEFDFAIMGLGYSFVEAEIAALGINTRHFVFARPIDAENTQLTVALSMKNIENPSKIHPVLSFFPRKLLQKIILSETFKSYKHDVSQDFAIWENKKYIAHPALAKGDGPLGLYRRYVRQFYYPDLVKTFSSNN